MARVNGLLPGLAGNDQERGGAVADEFLAAAGHDAAAVAIAASCRGKGSMATGYSPSAGSGTHDKYSSPLKAF